MTERQFMPLPDGLADLAPGPDLGAALALVDRTACNGLQLVRVVEARHRQLCWEQAQLLADMHELAHAPRGAPDSPPERSLDPDTDAARNVSAALAVTTRAAAAELALASSLSDGFEPVRAALAAGQIDLAKAKMILREVSLLDAQNTATVLRELLSTVDHRSHAAIRNTARRLVLDIDPRLVWRRAATASRRRYVRHAEHADGTASITARFLSNSRVAAAFDSLDQLSAAIWQQGQLDASSASGGSAADGPTVAQIRADVFLDLLQGLDPMHGVAVGSGGSGSRRGTKKRSAGRRHHRSAKRSPRPAVQVATARHGHRPPPRRGAGNVSVLSTPPRRQ
jgi:Domain of unknown function (DUF222)